MSNEMTPAEAAEEIERFTAEFVDESHNPIDYSSKTLKSLSLAASILRKVANGELREVVHAEWSHIGGDDWCCTNCGYVDAVEIYNGDALPECCPSCGAKMDGKGGADHA